MATTMDVTCAYDRCDPALGEVSMQQPTASEVLVARSRPRQQSVDEVLDMYRNLSVTDRERVKRLMEIPAFRDMPKEWVSRGAGYRFRYNAPLRMDNDFIAHHLCLVQPSGTRIVQSSDTSDIAAAIIHAVNNRTEVLSDMILRSLDDIAQAQRHMILMLDDVSDGDRPYINYRPVATIGN
jgi:hypothetical protein